MSASGETEKKRKRDEIEGQNGDFTAAPERTAVAVEDREVDEFFAIIRRMHAAYSHLKKSGGTNGGGLPLTERQDVRSEDDGDRHGINGGDHAAVREREVVLGNAGLDLNADPIPEPDPV